MPKSKMVDIVNALLHASEKAALITRACCGFGPDSLLVSEKVEGEANARFDHDFKTIADVLAQVAAKHEIEIHCKELVGNVRGEEGIVIGGVTIELKATAKETAELLSILVPKTIAVRMAEAAHHKLHVDIGNVVPSECPDIDPADVGVWIDPIVGEFGYTEYKDKKMPKSKMVDIVNALLHASEKAALITRACCGFGPDSLLVSEKVEGEANARFDHDFKTIADVLAQVAAKHEIEIHCKELVGNVRGEEGIVIGGVTIELKATAKETAELLSILVPKTIAVRMAEAAHHKLHVDIGNVVPSECPDIDPADVGVWIDPIDATAQFIAGVNGTADVDEGLPCVTVLVGSYLKSTGEPLFGVIHQPFFYNDSEVLGRMIWGLCYGDVRKWGMTDPRPYFKRDLILLSAAEKMDMMCKIKIMGYELQAIPGAGHKLMKVALGQAAAYFVSKDTTFRWDTCAAHPILKAKGGEILNYTTRLPLTYNDPEGLEPQAYANVGGIIAFGLYSTYDKLKDVLEVN